MEAREKILRLSSLNKKLSKIESLIQKTLKSDPAAAHEVQDVVSTTLAVSFEITAFIKSLSQGTSSVGVIAQLLRRQSILLRRVCRLQRAHVKKQREKAAALSHVRTLRTARVA